MATNVAALLLEPQADLVLQERPIPKPNADEVVVRNHALALNPVDWKKQSWGYAIDSYPEILGSDIAGIVADVGSSVTKFKKGDRVLAWTSSRFIGRIDGGAFQTYSVARETVTSPLPDNLSFEQGAVVPLGILTAAAALFDSLGIPAPPTSSSSSPAAAKDGVLLVSGGSSSVGSNGVQLGRRLGLTVIATASKQHHEYVRSLGATAVVDYHSPTVVEDLAAAVAQTGKPLVHVYDAISEASSLKPIVALLDKAGAKDAKLAVVLPWPEAVPKPASAAVVQVLATPFASKATTANWLFKEFIPSGLKDGSFVPSPKLELLDGGLGGLQAGLNKLKAGVSARKLVLKVD
ncbi:hypothetical protein VTK73DRAFT_10300 [Phialemonium thermophilum]|uniref:Enoyl reductase (ER) domain-containing protein n=1 Tax=Phialemonium thermophilum TaxID=223376 RepID=A0ABR3VXF2_9PEZI